MMGKRVRKTRQTLDSNRNSVVIDEDQTDTDEESSIKPSRKNDQRKKRPKNPRYKSSDHRDKKEHKRRSWTDSGVSLSLTRTDQSRCGTFENGASSKKMKNIFDKDNINYSIEDDYVVPLRRKTSNQSQKISDIKSFNRLSQITTRSSLTNVSILTANSMTSLSSMSESELEYFSDSDSSTTIDNIGKRNIEYGSQLSITSSTSTIKEDREVTDPQSYIDSQLKIYQQRVNKSKSSSSIPQNTPSPKRNSIIKRVKAHFRPHHKRQNKNYKDVSSEFFFEKIEKSKEAEDQYEIITTDVLKRLHEEESGKQDFYVDDIYYEDDLTEDENEDDGERDDPLGQTFSGNPKENKTFIGKFFKRTRSYSVSPQLEKKGGNGKRFSRNSLRASVRSNPEVPFKEKRPSNVGRYTASMDNLDKTHELRTDQMNRSETFSCGPYNRSASFYGTDRNNFECAPNRPSIQKSTSYYGIPSPQMSPRDGNKQKHSNVHSTYNVQATAPSASVPHSPSGVFDLARFQNLHISNNQGCDCQQCLYADYLDYLEFQRFRRYYSSQSCCGPCCTPHAVPHQPIETRVSPCFHPRDNGEIVDVLPITKDTEKEAIHLKTSKYESFV